MLLRLTEPGQRIVDEVAARRREEIGVIVARMSAESTAGLVSAMCSFVAAGGEPANQEPSVIRCRWTGHDPGREPDMGRPPEVAPMPETVAPLVVPGPAGAVLVG